MEAIINANDEQLAVIAAGLFGDKKKSYMIICPMCHRQNKANIGSTHIRCTAWRCESTIKLEQSKFNADPIEVKSFDIAIRLRNKVIKSDAAYTKMLQIVCPGKLMIDLTPQDIIKAACIARKKELGETIPLA